MPWLSYRVFLPDLTFLSADGGLPICLPGAHRCARLRHGHRAGRVRARLPDRPRDQSLRLDLRLGVRRAVRGRLPARQDRCADRHPRPQALRRRPLRRLSGRDRRSPAAAGLADLRRPDRTLRSGQHHLADQPHRAERRPPAQRRRPASASPSSAQGRPDLPAPTIWPCSATRSRSSRRPRSPAGCCASASPNIACRAN